MGLSILQLEGFWIDRDSGWPFKYDLGVVALLRSQPTTPTDLEVVREINVVCVSQGEVSREPNNGARSGDADDPPLDETACAVP